MKEQEIQTILNSNNAYVIAPAGHGKTEMIAELVEKGYEGKKILVITHTNAGVSAIKSRFIRKKIDSHKYKITTIAGLCTRWCNSYPSSGAFDKSLSPENKDQIKGYYSNLYMATKSIFLKKWSGEILNASYGGVIVDEYQDCIKEQHEIMQMINRYIPVWVLGDPMQGIFDWAGELVDWNKIGFRHVEVETYPWRWEKSSPDLGQYLLKVRNELFPVLSGKTVNITINDADYIKVIRANGFNPYTYMKEWTKYKSVLFIAKLEYKQLSFCKRMGGVFQEDEKQDSEVLYELADAVDNTKNSFKVLEHIKFMKKCSSNMDREIGSYIKKLENGSIDFARIKKNTDFGELITRASTSDSYKDVEALYKWIMDADGINIYRRELLYEALRGVRYAESNNCTVKQAIYKIRTDSNMQKRYDGFHFLSSRTVLSKGLEFECVIIDMSDPLKMKDFYVAMTRAMKKIYIISDTRQFTFS